MEFQKFHFQKDLDQQRELFLDCFPENTNTEAATKEHYFWKFHAFSSHVKPSYECAAFEKNKLVGYYAAIPYPYQIQGRKLTCGMVCDVMTHSSCRGKGVFTQLGKYSLKSFREDGIDFVSGYPIRPEVLPGHLKVGWFVAFELPLYLKVLRVGGALKSKRLSPLIPFGNFLAKSYLFFFKKPWSKKLGYELRAFSKEEFLDLEAYDAFFAEWAKDIDNHLVKSRDFLRWRLGQNGANYEALTVWKGSKLVALSIMRKVPFQKIPCLGILDLMVLPKEQKALHELHRALEQKALQSGADVIAIMMSRTSARRSQLISHGFVRSSAKFKLILNRLHENVPLDPLRDEKNWNLTWIDSDDL